MADGGGGKATKKERILTSHGEQAPLEAGIGSVYKQRAWRGRKASGTGREKDWESCGDVTIWTDGKKVAAFEPEESIFIARVSLISQWV